MALVQQTTKAMLGKRQRTILPDASAGKRLRANIDDLLTSGLISAARHVSLLQDAYQAGVQDCYSAVGQRLRVPKPQALMMEMLKDKSWPALREMPLPLKNKEGQTVPGKLAFLLPHELLYALVSNSQRARSLF